MIFKGPINNPSRDRISDKRLEICQSASNMEDCTQMGAEMRQKVVLLAQRAGAGKTTFVLLGYVVFCSNFDVSKCSTPVGKCSTQKYCKILSWHVFYLLEQKSSLKNDDRTLTNYHKKGRTRIYVC